MRTSIPNIKPGHPAKVTCEVTVNSIHMRSANRAGAQSDRSSTPSPETAPAGLAI
jgi:hypothetical protein